MSLISTKNRERGSIPRHGTMLNHLNRQRKRLMRQRPFLYSINEPKDVRERFDAITRQIEEIDKLISDEIERKRHDRL